MSFGELLCQYYSFIFIMIILLYTIIFNRTMYSKVRNRFILLIFLVVLEADYLGVEFLGTFGGFGFGKLLCALFVVAHQHSVTAAVAIYSAAFAARFPGGLVNLADNFLRCIFWYVDGDAD